MTNKEKFAKNQRKRLEFETPGYNSGKFALNSA